MKCPIDKTEMEKGVLQNDGTGWSSGMLATINRMSGTLFNVKFGGSEAKKVDAYRCSKCGKVELTTESDK